MRIMKDGSVPPSLSLTARTSRLRARSYLLGAGAMLLILSVPLAACSSSPSISSESTGGSSGEPTCPPPVNTGDGSSACGMSTCAPGQYCFDSATGDCENGCVALSSCATGDYCDLSNPTEDAMMKSIGTCRSPACSNPKDSGSSACPDVHGVYKLTLDSASSSAQCALGIPNTTTCTITQTMCNLEWSCDPGNGFMYSTIDDSGAAQSNMQVPAPEGQPANCTLQFSNGPFTWDCHFIGKNETVDCNGDGAPQ
jgi:hypothetical protein